MRYLTIFSKDRPHLGAVAVFDTKAGTWIANGYCLQRGAQLPSDLRHYFGNATFYGLLSHYQDLMSANWVRDRSGEILQSEQPAHIEFNKLLALTCSPPPSALVVLRFPPARRTPAVFAQRYTPQTIFTPVVLSSASAMKAEGMSWSQIATRLGVKSESLQTTLRKAKKQAPANA
jgi:hypothetical protein